jgi:hypothetical protein
MTPSPAPQDIEWPMHDPPLRVSSQRISSHLQPKSHLRIKKTSLACLQSRCQESAGAGINRRATSIARRANARKGAQCGHLECQRKNALRERRLEGSRGQARPLAIESRVQPMSYRTHMRNGTGPLPVSYRDWPTLSGAGAGAGALWARTGRDCRAVEATLPMPVST